MKIMINRWVVDDHDKDGNGDYLISLWMDEDA